MSDMTVQLVAPDVLTGPANLKDRKRGDSAFVFWGFGATALGLVVLATLLFDLVNDGGARLTPDFFFSATSNNAASAGILMGWVGSILLIVTTALLAVPLGVMAGLYLEEYAPRNRVTALLEVATNNLAGVPSVVFGLLGLALFVVLPGELGIGSGRVDVQAAGMTLALLVLPVIIVATREALRGVPRGIREAALSVGATKLQTTGHHVLPYAASGIVTGVIIGLSRALGETAPLIILSVPVFSQRLPGQSLDDIGELTYTASGTQAPITLFDVLASWQPFGPSGWLAANDFSALPVLMFDWVERPDPAFQNSAAAAGLVLLVLTLALNGFAIWYRYRLRKSIKW